MPNKTAYKMTIASDEQCSVEIAVDEGKIMGITAKFTDPVEAGIVRTILKESGFTEKHGKLHHIFPVLPEDDCVRIAPKDKDAFEKNSVGLSGFLGILQQQGHITPENIRQAMEQYWPHTGSIIQECKSQTFKEISVAVPASPASAEKKGDQKPVALNLHVRTERITSDEAIMERAKALAHNIDAVHAALIRTSGGTGAPEASQVVTLRQSGAAKKQEVMVRLTFDSLADAESMLDALQQHKYLEAKDVAGCKKEMKELQPDKNISMPVQAHKLLTQMLER